MSAPCRHTFSHRPSFLSPPICRIRPLKLFKTPLSFNRTSLIVNSLSRSSKNKWRFSYFRREDSLEFLESKCEEEKAEELVNPEFNQPNVVKDDWISNLKKGIDIILFILTVICTTMVGIMYCPQPQNTLINATLFE